MEILLKSIAEEEGVKLTEGGLKAIKRYAEGNAGVAISLMEAAAVSSTSVPSEPEPKVIDVDRVEEVVRHAFFQRKKAEELIDLAFEGRHKEVREGLEFLMEGERIQGEEILLEIHKALKRKMEEMKMKMKIEMKREEEISAKSARLILYESEADLKLCSSLNNMIHLEELLMRFKV
jgi:DNA polymerase III delta prime subunit